MSTSNLTRQQRLALLGPVQRILDSCRPYLLISTQAGWNSKTLALELRYSLGLRRRGPRPTLTPGEVGSFGMYSTLPEPRTFRGTLRHFFGTWRRRTVSG